MANGVAIAFDTLKFANRLKAAGIKPEHAEAEAEAIAEVFEVNIKGLANKADLGHLEERFGANLEGLEERFDAKFERLEERFDAKFERLEERFDAKLEGLEERFDAKFERLEARVDAKFELQRKDMDAKFAGMEARHESLRKDMAGMEQRIVLKLGRVVAAGIGLIGIVLPIMLKLLHVF